MRNELATGHSISFRLKGTTRNRDAMGARVAVELSSLDADWQILIGSVRAGEGFLSQSSKAVHFGLVHKEFRQATKVF